MNPTEQFLRDFIAWCKQRSVPFGSELADLQARAEALLRLLTCVEDMEAEAKQFGQCAAIHKARGNESAAAVALRAQEIITRFAVEVKQANHA